MTDSAIARSAYANGTDPVDWAVQLTQIQIETAAEILIAREHRPGAYPQFRGELSAEAAPMRETSSGFAFFVLAAISLGLLIYSVARLPFVVP